MPTAKLIVVNESGEEIAVAEELKCHQGEGILHRAFTILVFNAGGEALIQRRSGGKLLWPGFWEASCSGHPREGEDLGEAAERRLAEELAIRTSLATLGSFRYRARYLDVGAENEFCFVLAGRYEGGVSPDPDEVSEYRWIRIPRLLEDIAGDQTQFVPWLAPALAVAEDNPPA